MTRSAIAKIGRGSLHRLCRFGRCLGPSHLVPLYRDQAAFPRGNQSHVQNQVSLNYKDKLCLGSHSCKGGSKHCETWRHERDSQERVSG